MRVYAPNGRVIEGTGVEPDVPVRPTRTQVLAGEDAVREAALRALAR
jgi:C-terminal processing protease CtpA/Prc